MADEDKSGRTIGSMNGPWAMMAKLALATYPIVVGSVLTWATWATVNIIETQSLTELIWHFLFQHLE